mmetsp:Transcript_19100/g.32900  ORF Transcript_19100/g.32900 Transcript_19100/m.32900 type:complete len:124 (-) Transcript_19100:31-402(-)
MSEQKPGINVLKVADLEKKYGSNKELIKGVIDTSEVIIFSKSYCPYCKNAKQLLTKNFPKATISVIELDNEDKGDELQSVLQNISGQRTVPNIYINKNHVGGASDTEAALKNGKLKQYFGGKL